uniref:Putative secreted protein n=1 Tax=Psorophora albipes TaxID=869069 RepID=T1DFF3_9DIPT
MNVLQPRGPKMLLLLLLMMMLVKTLWYYTEPDRMIVVHSCTKHQTHNQKEHLFLLDFFFQESPLTEETVLSRVRTTERTNDRRRRRTLEVSRSSSIQHRIIIFIIIMCSCRFPFLHHSFGSSALFCRIPVVQKQKTKTISIRTHAPV